MKKVLLVSGAVIAMAATPAMAQVSKDSDSLTINLEGEVQSVCAMTPDGPINATVDMTETGDQGNIVVAYSCNSPYELRLSSLNGGMRHFESGGQFTVPYAIETVGFELQNGFVATDINSGAIHNTPTAIAAVSDWANIVANAGVRTGELDLNFAGQLDKLGAAGTYQDTLTVTLAADW